MAIFDNKIVALVTEIKDFFESRELMFYKIEEEQQGIQKYLRITVSLKIQ